MKIQNKYLISIAAIACMLFAACSNDDSFPAETPSAGPTRVIYQDIVLESENGAKENYITRGVNDDGFTNDYPFDYIYVHSTTDESKTLKVPLKEVEYCGDCRGIHLEMVVTDGGDTYTLRTSADDEGITLSKDETVYFSSYPTTTWEAQPLENSSLPISSDDTNANKDVFTANDKTNIELLKSELDYDMDDLIELLQTPKPQIMLARHCTGFMVDFMFTNVEERGGGDDVNKNNYYVDEESWPDYVPSTKPSDFYIKLFIGPNFCHEYNIYNNDTPEDDQGGFYVINNNQYTPLSTAYLSYQGLSGERYSYDGFGYMTTLDNILLAPLNTSLDLNNFAIYVFIKYDPEGTNDVNSDAGSVYLKIPLEEMTFELNVIHRFILCLDAKELQKVVELTNSMPTITRGYWSAPTLLELKHPVMVKHVEDNIQEDSSNKH